MSKRIEVTTKTGEKLSILVEKETYGCYVFPYNAVLNDWDEGCKHANGKTPSQAVSELLDLIDAETDEDLRWLDAFFPESLPPMLRPQHGPVA